MKDISVPSDLLETIYTRLQDHLDQQAPTMVALRLLLQSTEEDSPDELDEIERLKVKLSSQSDVIKALADTCNQYCAEIDQLKADNAELKANLCESLADSMMDVVELKAENERLKAENEEWSPVMQKLGDQNDKLCNQLDEVKKMADDVLSRCDHHTDDGRDAWYALYNWVQEGVM